MGNTFNSKAVTRRAYQAFPEAEYVLELENPRVREASTGTWQVLITFRIRGERYDNLTVFETLSLTEKSFDVTMNKLADMGLELPEINTASAKSAAEKIQKALPVGARINARVYETEREGGGYVRNVRGYLGLVK